MVLGAIVTGDRDSAQTNPVVRVRWDNFCLLTGEEPGAVSAHEPGAAEAVAPFALAATAPAGAWEPVNLAAVANRPLRGDDAFIGMPLIQVRPGPMTAAGVPFQILDGEDNNDMGCVALRSARIYATRGKPLPSAVEVPVSGTARAVYFLHGAGWVTTHNAFATGYTDATFTGQRRDVGTGLYFYGARWYDPVVGRFIQADPLVPEPGNPQSLNRYSYVLNNSLR